MSSINRSVFHFINHFSGQHILLDYLGIFFAEYLPYLLVLAFLILAFYQQGRRKKLYVFAEGALAVILARGIITPLIQYFYHEARPFTVLGIAPLIGETGWAFPSAHMTWFFALSMAVWYANRKWGAWFLVLTALMGIARVYVGVHWPFDIVAGAIIGVVSAVAVHWFLRNERKSIYEKISIPTAV